jgi:hypothetical protein
MRGLGACNRDRLSKLRSDVLGRNMILIGKAQEIDLIQPKVREMLEHEGIYIAGDTKTRSSRSCSPRRAARS